MAKKTKAITIRCNDELIDRLNNFVDVYGQSKTTVVERALYLYFDTVEKNGITTKIRVTKKCRKK